MPRTVEGIVQCHQLARERKRQGRPVWEGELTFLSKLGPMSERFEAGDESLTAQMMLDTFQEAAKEIRAKVPQAKGKHFEPADEDLEWFVVTLEEEWNISFVENCPDILEAFNEILDRLYDWCDVNRWWIKPAP